MTPRLVCSLTLEGLPYDADSEVRSSSQVAHAYAQAWRTASLADSEASEPECGVSKSLRLWLRGFNRR